MNKTEEGWKVVRIVNYRDYLDFVTPIQTSGLLAYKRATEDIIDKYNDILDTQQTRFNQLTATSDGCPLVSAVSCLIISNLILYQLWKNGNKSWMLFHLEMVPSIYKL